MNLYFEKQAPGSVKIKLQKLTPTKYNTHKNYHACGSVKLFTMLQTWRQ